MRDDDLAFRESPASETRPSVKGLRLVTLPPIAPEVLGASPRWHWLGVLWWYLKRRWLIFWNRRRDI